MHDERTMTALDAACEAEALAHALVELNLVSGELLTRGIAMRLMNLAGIVVAALGDDSDPIDEIRFRFLGRQTADQKGGAA